MARSTYVYVVQATQTGKLLAAFTVKHELIRSAVRNGWDLAMKRGEVAIHRIPDGGPRTRRSQSEFTVEELFPSEET